VRYYQGADVTGVVTEVHFFQKDGVCNACDCAKKCLQASGSCTNWVWKKTFMTDDGGKRSCTLYSSPNLPANVTLAYDTARSLGFQLLQNGNNPQVGSDVPLAFLDATETQFDKYAISGLTLKDQMGRQYC
jgi:hypothetical protein